MVDAHPELYARPDAASCMAAAAARAGVTLTLPEATGVAKALGRLQPVAADAAFVDALDGDAAVPSSEDPAALRTDRGSAFATLLRAMA